MIHDSELNNGSFRNATLISWVPFLPGFETFITAPFFDRSLFVAARGPVITNLYRPFPVTFRYACQTIHARDRHAQRNRNTRLRAQRALYCYMMTMQRGLFTIEVFTLRACIYSCSYGRDNKPEFKKTKKRLKEDSNLKMSEPIVL